MGMRWGSGDPRPAPKGPLRTTLKTTGASACQRPKALSPLVSEFSRPEASCRLGRLSSEPSGWVISCQLWSRVGNRVPPRRPSSGFTAGSDGRRCRLGDNLARIRPATRLIRAVGEVSEAV